MHLPENYTRPVLCTANPQDWYVYFEFNHQGKWHIFKKREGINRIKELKDRQKEGELLAEARLMWLQSGWNPTVDPKFKMRGLTTTDGVKAMLFEKAMDFALSKKDLASKSRIDYSNQLEHIKTTAQKLGISYLPISQVTRLHVLELLEHLKADRKFSNANYNKYRDTLRAMFSTLETWLAVEHNPATKIESLRMVESNKYVALTNDEKLAIREHLFTSHFRFYVYIQVLYHTGIRPKEILFLKIKDIDLEKRNITIVPDLATENSKTKNVRIVPINSDLLQYLLELKLDRYDTSFYVFGSPFLPGIGNRGWGTQAGYSAGQGQEDYFTPSPNQIKRDTVTKLWKKIVKDTLGINKHLYALKHTGADDKILAGIDLDALRDLYGHRSKYMTETYAKRVKEVYRDQIRDKSPSFTHGPDQEDKGSANPGPELKTAKVIAFKRIM